MFYSPFIELIEHLLRWVKNLGSLLYWVWIGIPAIVGGMAFAQMLNGVSWEDTKELWILTALLFFLPLPFVYWHERKWKANRR